MTMIQSKSISRFSLPGVVAVMLTILCSGAAKADVGFYTEHETVMPNPQTQQPVTKTVRSWHQGKKFKKENPLTGETTIVDLDRKKAFGVNDEKKTYWELPTKEYQKLSLMQLFTLGVTATPDGKISVRDDLFMPTGKAKKIDGKTSYEVKINYPPMPAKAQMEMATSIWLSEEVDIPKAKLIDELRITLNNPKGPEFEKLFNHWKRLDGYPILTETVLKAQGKTIRSTEKLTVHRKEKFPKSMFQVPKGYKKTIDPMKRIEQMQKQLMQKQAEMKKANEGKSKAKKTRPAGAIN